MNILLLVLVMSIFLMLLVIMYQFNQTLEVLSKIKYEQNKVNPLQIKDYLGTLMGACLVSLCKLEKDRWLLFATTPKNMIQMFESEVRRVTTDKAYQDECIEYYKELKSQDDFDTEVN